MTEQRKRPFQDYIDLANEGELWVNFSDDVRVNAEEFVYIDRDCDAMKDRIRQLQDIARRISEREVWGLGEDPSSWLRTGKVLVSRFRTKAKGAEDGNDVHTILERHWESIDGIQELHRSIAQRYVETDSEFAGYYNSLMASVPQGFQPKS